MAWHCKFCVN
uniref:Uncharacterized protein n=1 Tax=Anguilla anguilla TaxID=7936 RepID=A0A0E9V128_ANGAN